MESALFEVLHATHPEVMKGHLNGGGASGEHAPVASPVWSAATYSEGERQLPIGLAGRVQADVVPLPALLTRTLALRDTGGTHT